jgi:hypothetical protein
VFVFTAPQDADIPAEVDKRISQLLTWLMPNLIQARYAVIRGTTATYTLSMFLQGSVVLCPDIQHAIVSYLWLCWQMRSQNFEEFMSTYNGLLQQQPPLEDESIEQLFGKEENYGVTVPNFESLAKSHDERWRSLVKSRRLPIDFQRELVRHSVKSCYVTPKEVAAALRFLNYSYHVESRIAQPPPEL